MKRYKPLALLFCAVLLSSCTLFDENAVQDITGPLATARIKFFNFAPGTPKLNFYAGDRKMTAVSSGTGSDTLGVVYPANAAGGLYTSIAPGQYTLSGRLATPADKDLAISNTAVTIADKKYYSYYLSGVYNSTTKTADAFVVEDPVPETADFAVAQVRFVNAISNGTGDLTLYATNTSTSAETAVGGAIAYKAAGGFIALPAGTYNLRASYTGSSTNLITRTGLSFVGGRVYTITSRGNTATTSTLGLDFTANQQ